MAPEQDRLEETYREHAPALHRFLLRLTASEAETRDLLQDIFIRLAREPRLLRGLERPRSYLFRLAHRLVIDRHRRSEARHRREEAFAGGDPELAVPPAGDFDLPWRRRVLASLLERLPEEQRAVVALKIWEEMTFAEIAEVLAISPHTAASRYRYAMDKMREALRPYAGDLR